MEVYIKYDKKGRGVRSKVLNGFKFFVKMCTREGEVNKLAYFSVHTLWMFPRSTKG